MLHSTHPSQTAQPELALAGTNGYAIQGNRIVITASEIDNNRHAGDVSGTLAIELWALNQPYHGGAFSGVAVAGTQIGELLGQHYLSDCRYDLVFNEPPAGSWNMVLMLREWTGDGYATRDYVNFHQPYVVQRKAVIAESKTDNVIRVSFPGAQADARAEVAKPVEQPAKPAAKAAPAGKQAKASMVSINHAHLHDLAEIKGMTKKLAESIIAARPFDRLEDVLKVKGMGPKLLEKLRKHISL